jgi:hypothetical protein
MIRDYSCRVVGALGLLISVTGFVPGLAYADAAEEPRLCDKVLTRLARSAGIDRDRRAGNVVEIRACDPGVLQLVAWGTAAERPLIVDTNRTSVASMTTAADTVYVIQTAGASSNVILFRFS